MKTERTERTNKNFTIWMRIEAAVAKAIRRRFHAMGDANREDILSGTMVRFVRINRPDEYADGQAVALCDRIALCAAEALRLIPRKNRPTVKMVSLDAMREDGFDPADETAPLDDPDLDHRLAELIAADATPVRTKRLIHYMLEGHTQAEAARRVGITAAQALYDLRQAPALADLMRDQIRFFSDAEIVRDHSGIVRKSRGGRPRRQDNNEDDQLALAI